MVVVSFILQLLGLFLPGLSEPLDGFAHRFGQLRKLAGTKDDQHD